MTAVEVIVQRGGDPVLNIAMEEALLDSVSTGLRQGPLARLWVNGRSVVVGRGLGLCEEVDCPRAGLMGIPVVRRISGGGAVYHDEGNINFTLVWRAGGRVDIAEVYRVGTGIVLGALSSLGLEGRVENVNDVVVSGCKVSGSAAAWRRGAALFHATLLVSSDIGAMKSLLRPDTSRVARGEVTPAKYNPCNLSSFVDLGVEEALATVLGALEDRFGGVSPAEPLGWEAERAAALARGKYSRPGWSLVPGRGEAWPT